MSVTMDQKIVFREPLIHMGDLKPLKTTKKKHKKSLKNALEHGFWLFLGTVAGSESIVGTVEPTN